MTNLSPWVTTIWSDITQGGKAGIQNFVFKLIIYFNRVSVMLDYAIEL